MANRTIKLRGGGIPAGYIVGRSGNNNVVGAAGLVKISDLATKSYVLQVAGLPAIPDGDIIANISGASAVPIANTLTAVIDYTLAANSPARGQILYRNATGWVILAPGTSGNVLTTAGPGADPAWMAGGTVTSVALALDSGLYTVSGSPVTGTGTLTGTLNTQTKNTLFAGPTSGSAAKPTFRVMVTADLAALTSGKFWLGNVSNVATEAAMSGDATMTNAGVVTIKTDVALAGNPTTTTQASSDSSTRIATTAFVQTVAAGGFVPIGAAYHPGFVSGPYYMTPMIQAFGSSTTLVANTLYAVPFFVPVATTFSVMGLHAAATVAGATGQIGIYSNVNGQPHSLEYDNGNIALTPAADHEITGLTIALSAGWHWLAVGINNTTPSVATSTSTSTYAAWLMGATTSTGGAVKGSYIATWTPGALPGTFPAITGTSLAVLCIYLRI